MDLEKAVQQTLEEKRTCLICSEFLLVVVVVVIVVVVGVGVVVVVVVVAVVVVVVVVVAVVLVRICRAILQAARGIASLSKLSKEDETYRLLVRILVQCCPLGSLPF